MTFMDEQQAMLLVSTIIITHNRKALIQRIIGCVKNKKHLNMEIIVEDEFIDCTRKILTPMSNERPT